MNMPSGALTFQSGIPIHSVNHLCRPTPVRPKRRHRRARIQRKWLKRFGWVEECAGRDDKGLFAYQIAGSGIAACPHAFAMIAGSLAP